MDYSVITCNEATGSYEEDTEVQLYYETNLNEKKATCKTQTFYNLLRFFLNCYNIIYRC